MKARMTNAAMLLPGALEALQAFGQAASQAGIPESTIDLVHYRASQINGCSVCADMHSRSAKKHGATEQQLLTLAAWRDTPYFSDAERAAIALAEAVTRLADKPDPVPDDVWNEAAKHYDERQLAALLVHIAGINAFNRLNVPTRQPSGEWVAQYS
ncbi:MAG TPA: carboxymuconolactone decarboxylase family protein [Chloroflexota bacterium]|nr:carboxymuconolactone decarboxylase family protein [Chloroflexota bacterium]